MADISWLSSQAQQIHGTFVGLFYGIVTLLLCIGVFIEFFKWPLGGVPSFPVLIGRALIAALLLHSYGEVSNTVAEVTDALAKRLGDLNQFKLVFSSLGDHLKTLSLSWVSVRDLITTAISFLTFFLLYFSIHIVEALLLYAWTLLYVFSPLLIALFVLPSTASATKALYKTLIEMGCWKIVWSVLATLLWSTALSDINKPDHDINTITSICFNLILAGSVLLTPFVVHALAEAGLSSMAHTVGSIAVGDTRLSPKSAPSMAKKWGDQARSSVQSGSSFTKRVFFGEEKKNEASSNTKQKSPQRSKLNAPKGGVKSQNKATVPTKKPPVKKPKPHKDSDLPMKDTEISEI